MQLPEIGDRFEGKYEILEIIGQGGFACVYRARDERMKRDVALKVLMPTDSSYGDGRVPRFMREARVFAELQDPHTITMFDFGQSEAGLFFMAFEYIDGVDLSQVLNEQGPLSPRVVTHVLTQVLSALREAHQHGVLHRDLKPANILVFEYGGDPYNVKLIDFGIAKPVQTDRTAITEEGRTVGTPRYMCPEQVFGDPLTPASDVYSLGLVAFELLVGTPAVPGTTKKEIRHQQVSGDPIRVPELAAPRPLRAVIDRMLEPDDRARYQSAADALVDVRSVLRDMKRSRSSVPVVPAPSAPPANSPASPRADRWVLFGAVGAVFFVAVIMLLTLLPSPRPPRIPVPVNPPERPHNDDPPPSPATAFDFGAADQPTSDGCGSDVPKQGVYRRRQRTVGLAPRKWVLRVPASYRSNARHPVVLMFHRSVADANSMLEETRFGPVADRHGFVVIAPESAEQMGWVGRREFAFVREVLRDSAAELCLDLTRVYALGEAAGGAFVTELACEMPLSAIATTGHGERRGAVVCEPAHSPPRLRLYGRNDPFVPVDGGAGCLPVGTPFMSAQDVETRWINVHGCDAGTDKPWFKHRAGTCRIWECARELVICETNAGHDWPHARGRAFQFPACESEPPKHPFPNGETIARFFDELGETLPEGAFATSDRD